MKAANQQIVRKTGYSTQTLSGGGGEGRQHGRLNVN